MMRPVQAEGDGVLAITVRDLQFRARQFLIAVIGAGLVFAMTLLLAGMAASFYTEITHTVHSVGVDAWVLPAGTSGPFTDVGAMPVTAVATVAALPGVTAAGPIEVSPEAAQSGPHYLRVTMIGAPPGGLGSVAPARGHAINANGEAVADTRAHAPIGGHLTIAGKTFTVVGLVSGLTLNGGSPDVWVTQQDAQAVLFGDRALVTGVVTRGVPTAAPSGDEVLTDAAVAHDTLRPMQSAVQSVDNSREFMWVVAAVIVAALVYVSSLQRVRDFAVLKAMGASSFALFAGVAVQAVLVTMAAAVVAALSANLLKPLYPLPVAIPASAYLLLPVTAIVVGIAASLVALRRAVSVDPALAFGAV
ncbi:MAG TPA: ABC transporter permease [Acidimicrobiales bacterium]|nr:ABC transporter permease [Acidimicrobiales bacterium]